MGTTTLEYNLQHLRKLKMYRSHYPAIFSKVYTLEKLFLHLFKAALFLYWKQFYLPMTGQRLRSTQSETEHRTEKE